MALADDILAVRLAVGDVPGNPFYPLLDDAAYESILTRTNNDINQSAKFAASSIGFMIAGWNTRETVGDLSFTNDFARNYQRMLQLVLTSPGLITIPEGIFPWSASADTSSKLLSVDICECSPSPRGCNC